MARTSPRQSKGFTLVELLVGLATSSIVLLAIAAAFMGFQVAYQRENGVKAATENARQAATWVEQYLRLAGYGINPLVAFDFNPPVPTATALKDNDVVLANEVWTDDLAFRFRDPAFLLRGTLVGTTLDPDTNWGVSLPVGQAVMVGCEGGTYTVGRLASATVAGNSASVVLNAYENAWGAGTNVDTNLVNSGSGTLACSGASPATRPYIMLVHELRIRLKETNAAAGAEPARRDLVVFRNFNTDVTGTTGYDVIATSIEDFQVAYIMNGPLNPADGDGNNTLGDAGGGIPSTSAAIPLYGTNYADAQRFSWHPGNIRGVRLSIVARGERVEARSDATTGRKGFLRPSPWENRPAPNSGVTVSDGFYRSTFTTTVRIPNMISRSFFVPALLSEGGVPGSNVSGG